MRENNRENHGIQRYWKWIFLAISIFLVVIFTKSPLGNAVKDFGSLYLNPSLYEDALTKVRAHKEASSLLGEPIETDFLFEGEIAYSEDRNSVKMSLPIKGSKIKARLDVDASKIEGTWYYKLIRVRNKKTKERIVVLQSE